MVPVPDRAQVTGHRETDAFVLFYSFDIVVELNVQAYLSKAGLNHQDVVLCLHTVPESLRQRVAGQEVWQPSLQKPAGTMQR